MCVRELRRFVVARRGIYILGQNGRMGRAERNSCQTEEPCEACWGKKKGGGAVVYYMF